MMKRLLFLYVALMSCVASMAESWYDFDYSIDKTLYTARIEHGNSSKIEVLSIPYSIFVDGQSYRVTEIGDGAFMFSDLKILEIPSSVTSIGEQAFAYCSNLTAVEIPNSVTTIGISAFACCSNLTAIEIPSSVTSIGANAFGNCTNLTSLSVEEGNMYYTSLDNVIYTKDMRTLVCCSGRKEGVFSIPSSVTTIEDCAFSGCESLTAIQIPSSVTSIGGWAFDGCSSLAEMEIPSSVTSIGECAFSYNLASLSVEEGNLNYTSLDNVIYTKDMRTLVCCSGRKNGAFSVPSSVMTIGPSAFSGCNITAIEIPSSVTTIEPSAFSYCKSLTAIEIPSSVTTIGRNTFYGCRNLTRIVIPSSVTSIGEWAFSNCESLTAIEIPSSVTSIGEFAFYYCINLTKIEILSSVTSIGGWAFNGCEKLETIVSYSVSPPSSNDPYPQSVFFSVPITATIIIPKGSKNAYETDPMWSCFTNFVESDDIAPIAVKDIKFLDDITIQDGSIVGHDNMRIYNMMGQDVTAKNGSLRGVYIVKVGEEITKVLVK